MKIVKKLVPSIIALLVVITAPGSLGALEVDVEEVTKSKPIKFKNYRGKYKRQDSKATIKKIGRKLAAGVRSKGNNRRVRFRTKYSLIHAVSKKEPEKLSADVFSIDRKARVGHVNAIRLILSGYLEKMYGYSPKNARTLAVFLTYYNAVYRGNTKYFGAKYKRVVMKHLNRRNAGLSTRYYNWPGKTRILLPLTEKPVRGKLDSIDPDIISDKKTRERIRKDDKNIPERKNLVDMKKDIIKRDKKEIEKEKKEVARKKETVERKKEKIKEKKEDIRKEREESKKITDPKKRKRREEEVAKKEKEIKKEEKKVKEEEKRVTEEEKKIEKKEETIAKKEESIKEEEKEIKKDELDKKIKEDPKEAKKILDEKEKKLEEKEKEIAAREKDLKEKKVSDNIVGDKLYYMRTNQWLRNGHYDNDFFLINAATRKIMKKSPVEYIAGRKYDIFSGGVVIITHKGNFEAAHRLTLIDRNTLEAKIHGTDNIFFRSFVEIRDSFVYAIVIEKNKYYLGKFDSSLKLVSKSAEEVHQDSFITFFGNTVYVNRKDRKIIVLNREDLKLIDTVKP
jgi:hypothetical protein